jgi:hypothetical protein
VQDQVYERWAVWLHPEVKCMGEFPDLGPCPGFTPGSEAIP